MRQSQSGSVKMKLQKPKGDLMEMAQSLNSIFKPSEQNRHMYIFKVLRQFKEHNNMFTLFMQMDKSLFKSQCITDVRKTHSEADLKILERIRALEQQASTFLNIQNLNSTEIQINMTKFDQKLISEDNLEAFNNYLQGTQMNTLPANITSQMAELSILFKDIETLNIQELKALIASKLQNEPLVVMGMPLGSYLQDLVLDDTTPDTAFDIAKLCILMLFRGQRKRYQSLNIPEFEISSIKEMVKQAISEFKKQLRGCDEAFKQLLKSLDTFTDNFDQYYEQFQLNGKEPSVLFVNFIDDVSKQYQNTDDKSSRVILSQFKRIQKEFGKKLGTQIDNPQIRQLYQQLERQISKAQTLIGMDDNEELDDTTNQQDEEQKQ